MGLYICACPFFNVVTKPLINIYNIYRAQECNNLWLLTSRVKLCQYNWKSNVNSMSLTTLPLSPLPPLV